MCKEKLKKENGMTEEKASGSVKKDSSSGGEESKKKRGGGIMSRIWNGIVGLHGDDFEKRLQHISKEEAAVLARMKRRSLTWRKMMRHLIAFSVLFEIIAVGYAIMTTRSKGMNWQMRAFRILPMFLLPGFSAVAYTTFVNIIRICDHRDHKTLERLRAERQTKIDELKERTNYYTTQQLIQRYDSDPAAKAAAATVLASKLGVDSGLKVFVGDELEINNSSGKSNDVEIAKASGLRNRKQVLSRSSSVGTTAYHSNEMMPLSMYDDGHQTSEHDQLVVEHRGPQAYTANNGGWIARIAALLVGEDPTQSYALICGNCHMHNGLARKEDFPFFTYYCPHCRSLNQPKHLEGYVSGSNSTSNVENLRMGANVELHSKASDSPGGSAAINDNPDFSDSEIEEETEQLVSEDVTSKIGAS